MVIESDRTSKNLYLKNADRRKQISHGDKKAILRAFLGGKEEDLKQILSRHAAYISSA